MTSIERTAYPRFTHAPSTKELREFYTPTPEDETFISTMARGAAPQLSLMILLKVFQRMWYFPSPEAIPVSVIRHIRMAMNLQEEVVPDITPRTLYKYHAAVRKHLRIHSEPRETKTIFRKVVRAVRTAVPVMDDPADLINVAIETLVNASGELPAFSTLDTLVTRIRKARHDSYFRLVAERLTPGEQAQLSSLLETQVPGQGSGFNRVKEVPKSATLSHLDEWLSRLTWLQSYGSMEQLISGLPHAKIKHFAVEARALHASDMWDFAPSKRFTFLVCLLFQATVATRDEVVQMFLKRMSKLRDRAKEELALIHERERETTEHLIEVLTTVLTTVTEVQDDVALGNQVRDVFTKAGGTTQLLMQCEQVTAHHGNAYQPLLAQFYTSHRSALFRVLKTLDFHATTQDQAVKTAIEFLLAHEQNRKEYFTKTLDLSFADKEWHRLVQVRQKGKDVLARRHLETCIFTYVAAELKTGDLCVRGSEQFADYREQLLSWEECEPKVAEYCQHVGFAGTADGFVEQVRALLTETANEVDRKRPANK